MAILPVLQDPDPRLRQVSVLVDAFGGETDRILADMIDTMQALDGLGLAAPQVNIHRRMFVMQTGHNPLCLINPEILWSSQEKISHEEGCLSVHGISGKVFRPGRIRVRYQDPTGQVHEREFKGIESICFQHELDHLNGILFIDRLSALRRSLSFKRHPRVLRAGQ